jgi:hypothetical protein
LSGINIANIFKNNTASTFEEVFMRKVITVAGIIALICVMAGVANAVPVQWNSGDNPNHHWYEIIDVSGGINWVAAKADAESRGGYLATITRGAENRFLTDDAGLGNAIGNEDRLDGRWIGGYQLPGSVEPDGGWQWVKSETWDFTNWWGEDVCDKDGNCSWEQYEPNNTNGNEDALIFAHGFLNAGKAWNDLNADAVVGGYVIEYDQYTPVSAPEPATLLLLAIGMVGLAGMRKRIDK